MAITDDYAAREGLRLRAYRDAYESEEAKAWIAGLSPEQREQAERAGLLRPKLDGIHKGISLEDLSAKQMPCVGPDVAGLREDPAPPASLIDILQGGPGCESAQQVLRDFLCASGHPELTWSCLQYLSSNASAKELAKRHGMSKQTFNYHVRTLQEQLGLPPMGTQKKASSRQKYQQSNRRKQNILTQPSN